MKNLLFVTIAAILFVASHQEAFSHEYESSEGAVYACIIANSERDDDGQISGDSWVEMEVLCRSLYED